MRKSQQEIASPKHESKSFGVGARKITYSATFVALALIMKFVGQFLTLTPSFKITFIYSVWLLAGATLGPVFGAIIGFSSDFLGAVIFPTGSINYALVLGNTLYPCVAGMIFKFIPIKNNAVKLLISGVSVTVLCTLGINSLALWLTYGYSESMTFWQYIAVFRWAQPIVAALNIAITVAMLPVCYKLKLLRKPVKIPPLDGAAKKNAVA